MAIYEVFGKKDLGHKVLDIEKVFSAIGAVDAITKIISYYSDSGDKGEVNISELRVWGSESRKGTSEFDPNILCECHSSPLWKCSAVLPATVSVKSDGISFLAGV